MQLPGLPRWASEADVSILRDARPTDARLEERGDKTMGNQMARGLFEVAHVYRAVYDLRTSYDRRSNLTVAGAIAYGEVLLHRDSATTCVLGCDRASGRRPAAS